MPVPEGNITTSEILEPEVEVVPEVVPDEDEDDDSTPEQG
jgi:hypothetical protein